MGLFSLQSLPFRSIFFTCLLTDKVNRSLLTYSCHRLMFPRQHPYGKENYWPFSPCSCEVKLYFIYYPLKTWLLLRRWKRRQSSQYYFPRATSWSLDAALNSTDVKVPFRLKIIPRKIKISYFFKQQNFSHVFHSIVEHLSARCSTAGWAITNLT